VTTLVRHGRMGWVVAVDGVAIVTGVGFAGALAAFGVLRGEQ
jgi:hypothetical protein